MYKRLFETDPWVVRTKKLPDEIRLMESLTSIGNGHMGMRGNFEEGYSGDSLKGTYIAGVWFPDKTRVGWWKNGYPAYFGKVINAVDFIRTDITLNREKVDLAAGNHKDFLLELDMRNGLLSRSYVYSVPGAMVKLSFRRFLSIVEPELCFMEIGLEVLEGRADIRIAPGLDGGIRNEDSNYGESFWIVEEHTCQKTAALRMRTRPNDFGTPRFVVTAVMDTRMTPAATATLCCDGKMVSDAYNLQLAAGERAVLHKTVAVLTDRDHPAEHHMALANKLLTKAGKRTFANHLAAQEAAWAERWAHSDVTIMGDAEAQQGIRFNLFGLFSTYYGEDERLNIGPKGFTGEKYGGATYWDTEAFLLPMYLSVAPPRVSEKLLEYRHGQLEGAFHNARQQGLAGALFPMVTFNGVECHNEWEITFEEIHRNGAIAWAIYIYTQYTGDESYLRDKGIEVLVAIARFWADRVHFSERWGMYMIHGVTGPNEYENNVNNNWYTNTLARWVLGYTLESLPKAGEEKKKSLGVTRREEKKWRKIADSIYLPEDEERGIFVQHDTFLDKEIKLASELDPAQRPLNQHWSWDRILRSCYIKQADVLQGIYCFGDTFTREEKARNFEFYEPLTVHESSLSASIHAILAAELGKEEKAVELYARTARLDLDNYNNDTEDGLHVTSMSGSWLVIVQGFAGMRVKEGRLSFTPFCPQQWKGYSFVVNFRGRLVELKVHHDAVNAGLRKGEPLEISVSGQVVSLYPDSPATLPV